MGDKNVVRHLMKGSKVEIDVKCYCHIHLEKIALIFECFFIQKVYSTEKTPFKRLFPSCIHFTVESTEALRVNCLVRLHSFLMQLGFQPSITGSFSALVYNAVYDTCLLIAVCCFI